jgi:hypothetical protein
LWFCALFSLFSLGTLFLWAAPADPTEPQQPLALTKDMVPDRLSKDSDASQN